MKHLLFTLIIVLPCVSLYGQDDPENGKIEKGEPVPPFFLQTLEGRWQSSEKAFVAPLNVLWFADVSHPNEALSSLPDSVKPTLVSVQLIDINPYLSITDRKGAYQALKLGIPVLFDYKKYVATAYNVHEPSAWFLVGQDGALLEFKYEGTVHGLLEAIKIHSK